MCCRFESSMTGRMIVTTLIVLSGLMLTSASIHADEEQPVSRWEKEIQAMEQKIAEGKTTPGRPLFVGSSSIRLWNLDQSFPTLKAVNHGFGGSELSDAVQFFDRVVVPVKPSVIVVYAGDNDISKGKTAEQVCKDFEAFVSQARSKLAKETPILFIAIKPSIRRWNLSDEMKQANGLIQEICKDQPELVFVDVWPAMLDEQGMPKATLFQKDGLHLNEAGYKLWSSIVLKHLPAGT